MNWKNKVNDLKKGKKEKLTLSDLHDRPSEPPVLVSFVDPNSLGFVGLSMPDGVDWFTQPLNVQIANEKGEDLGISSPDGAYKKAIFKNEQDVITRRLIMTSGQLTDGEALVKWLEENFNSMPGWLLSPTVAHEAPTQLYEGGPNGFIYTFCKLYNDKTANVVELRSYDNGNILYSMSVLSGSAFSNLAKDYEIDLDN